MKKKIDNPIWQKKENWWFNVWKKAGLPFFPSQGEIKFYKKTVDKIAKRNNPKVLVLGATPQIRDLLAEYRNIQVYLIDVNIPVYRAMTRLRKKKNPREKLVVADWLKMPFPDNFFDLVVGHGSFSVIKLKNHQKLYQNIKRVVKKDGYILIGRCNVEIFLRNPITLKQLIVKYKKDPDYFKNFQNRVYILYRLIKEPGVYDRRIQGFRYHVLVKKAIDYAKKQGLSDKQIQDFYFIYPELGPKAVYTDVDIESIKKVKVMTKKHFVIKEVYQDDYHPIAKVFIDFLCQVKK